jgi:tetratricopeptide (TPR) repeat protein
MRPLLSLSYAAVFLSLVLRWTNASISRAYRAFSFPLSGDLNHAPHFLPFSYGCLIVLLLAISGLALLAKAPRAFWLISASLLGVTLYAPIQIAYTQPERLRTLLLEHDQYRKVIAFTNQDMPVNRGVEPTFEAGVDLTTVWDRFEAAKYFLSQGWNLLLGGSLAIFVLAHFRLDRRLRLPACLAALTVYVVVLVISVSGAVVGEIAVRRALVDDLEGRIAESLSRYRTALKHDRWYRLRPYVYRQIGELQAKSGVTDTAEYHLYEGTVQEQSHHMPLAIFENETAASLSPELREIGLEESARVAATYAASLHQEKAIGGAITYWQRAIRNDPRQFFALYSLGRAYHELAAYQKAVEICQELMLRCSNPLILANIHSNLADAFEKLGQFAEARVHYALSEKLDDDRNFRAYNSLTGQ